MKKIITIFITLILFTGCGSEKEYTASPINNDINNQKAGNIIITNKAFTINQDSTELMLELTNKNTSTIYIKEIKIEFKNSEGKTIYTKTEKVDKEILSNKTYNMNVKCDKALVETSDFKYELTTE